MQLTIPYNKKGKERKRLAEDIGNALGTIPKYLGVPSMCYQMGDCLLDKNGTLTIPDIVERETAKLLLAYLEEHSWQRSCPSCVSARFVMAACHSGSESVPASSRQ